MVLCFFVRTSTSMKKILTAIGVIAMVAIGLVVYSNKRVTTQPDEITVHTEVQAEEYVSARTALMPTVGTNIAKPGQFDGNGSVNR